jgi:hypothetical protein
VVNNVDNLWQPIETAPKDGTRVLACLVGDTFPFLTFSFGGQWIDDDTQGEVIYPPPTHWQPLPKPPEAL